MSKSSVAMKTDSSSKKAVKASVKEAKPKASAIKAPAVKAAKAPAAKAPAAKAKAPARQNKADITRKMLTDALGKVGGDASKLPRQQILKRLQTNKSTQMTQGQSVRYYHMCLHDVLDEA